MEGELPRRLLGILLSSVIYAAHRRETTNGKPEQGLSPRAKASHIDDEQLVFMNFLRNGNPDH